MPRDVRFVGNDGCDGIEGVAVVIDVLRAFSFSAYALALGVERLILHHDLDEALALARSIGALAGKDGVPHPDFDLFNSPGQLLERDDLLGQTVVHRTGAGTIGAVAARHAEHLYCASFVVARATVDRLVALAPLPVTFVISGGDGKGDDDLACAEYLAGLLAGESPDPAPYLARADRIGEGIRRGLDLGYTGVHPDDVALCLDLDRFDFALRGSDEDGHLVLRQG